MKNIILILLLLQFSIAYAQDLQISINNVNNYSVPDQILGVNTETSFPYKNNSYKRWLDVSTNYTTFVPNFKTTVQTLGFKSFYFPGGSIGRLYHYSPTGHGYCLKLNEALKMDSDYNLNHNSLGTPNESHENKMQYDWENDPNYTVVHPLPPPYLEKHRELCQLNSSTTVVSVNVLWSQPSELKTILDAFTNNGVQVAAIIMGTEVDNTGDAVLLPNGAPDYINKIDPFMSMLTDPSNPLYNEAYSSIPIAVDAAGDEGYNGTAWNQAVSSYMSTNYSLPKTGALNWWWYPEACTNAMGDPKSCFDEYFQEKLPTRVVTFKAYFDHMYVVQYGVKNSLAYEYANTFISELFPLKNIFWMIDYNAMNGEFFKGAYFMKLGTSSSYDPIWDDAKTSPIEINHSSSYDAFVMAKEIAGKKYIHTTLTQQTGNPVHSESYFFRDSVSNTGKLFILNSSGIAETLHSLSFGCQLVTGQITVRTTSAASLLTPKSAISSLISSTQTSATGSYNILVPGFSIIIVDFNAPTSSVTATAASSPICVGASTVLSASGSASYSWSPSTGLSSTTGSSVTATPTSTITYTVTATSNTGCITTKSVTVSIGPNPVITGTNVICAGASSSFDAGTGFSGYQWSTGATTQAINVNTAGTYTVTVAGCNIAASRQLTVNPLPTILVTPASSSICLGNNISMTASGASTYTWSPATGLNASTGATVTATPTVTTIYTVTGAASTGCSATKSVTISVVPVPVITGTNVICAGASSSFNAGTGYTGYVWSTGATTQSINVSTAGTYTVTVAGCSTAASRQLTVNALPTVLVTPASSSICLGNNISMTASGASTYTWSPATGLNVSTGATVTATPLVTTIYTVTGTGSTGCSATKSVTMSVVPVPVITGTNVICAGASSSFDAGTGYTGYVWSTGATTQAINVSTAGTYTVTVAGCNIAASRQLTVNALPTVLVTPASSSICLGNNISMTASGASTYTWSPATGLNVSTGATVTATPLVTTIYTVTGTGSTGCSATKSVTISVVPVPVITGTNVICAGASSSFDAGTGYTGYVWSTGATTQAINVNTTGTYTVTVAGCSIAASRQLTVNALPTILITPASSSICLGNNVQMTASGASTYTWSPATGLNVSTGATVTATPTVTTIYTATGTGSTGCSATKSVTISVVPVPVITGTNVICPGASSSFDAGTGYTGYVWSTGETTQTITVNTAGTYTVTVAGCSIAASRQLTVDALPTLLVTPESLIILPGESAIMTASGASTYTWSPATGLNVSTGATVTATPFFTIIYTVTGTGSTGCSATKSVTLSIGSNMVITGDSDICAGASSTFDAGTGYTGYVWSTGDTTQAINVNIAGTYTVTVTGANGFVGAASRQLTVNPSPTVSVSPASLSICPGDTILMTASGASTYTWTPSIGLSDSTGATVSATPAVTTSYTVTGTSSSGCSALASSTATISFPLVTGLSATSITANSAMANWTTVLCAAGYKINYRAALTTKWSNLKINSNTGNLELSGLTSSTVYDWKVATKRTDGTYTKFTKKKSFTTLAVRIAGESDEQDSKSDVSVFPNPTTGAFRTELNISEDLDGDATITVQNAVGLTVSKQVATVNQGLLEEQILLDKTLPAGIYFINVNISDASYSGKVFLQR